MTLKEYLRTRNISGAEFARRVGVSRGLICHNLSGRRTFSPSVALRVSRETFGEVSLEEALFPNGSELSTGRPKSTSILNTSSSSVDNSPKTT